MNCATTQSLKTREMDLDETLEFLEAQEAVKDENGKIIKEAHGAAICQTSKDYVSLKTALEQACIIMKKRCTYEIKKMIKKFGNAIELVSPSIVKTDGITSDQNGALE
jgi:hypothetical protein